MCLGTAGRKNKDGAVVEYYALAHNRRHPETGKPVARIIHSFGRADHLDRDHLVRLCQSIAKFCGLQVIDPVSNTDDDKVSHQFNNALVGVTGNIELLKTDLPGNEIIKKYIVSMETSGRKMTHMTSQL